MRSKHFLVQQQNLGQRFSVNKMHLSPPPGGFGCCPFYGGGSVVVDLLFNVLLIVCGSVSVFVLLCITLCSF